MRIKVKWTSCGHRKDMALLCFYDYADGYRQSVGYLCRDCVTGLDSFNGQLWLLQATLNVYSYRALYLDKIGDIRVVFARVAGAEDVLPDGVLDALPAKLDAEKLAHAREKVVEPLRQSGMPTTAAEMVAEGISFAVETGASPEDYKRR